MENNARALGQAPDLGDLFDSLLPLLLKFLKDNPQLVQALVAALVARLLEVLTEQLAKR